MLSAHPHDSQISLRLCNREWLGSGGWGVKHELWTKYSESQRGGEKRVNWKVIETDWTKNMKTVQRQKQTEREQDVGFLISELWESERGRKKGELVSVLELVISLTIYPSDGLLYHFSTKFRPQSWGLPCKKVQKTYSRCSRTSPSISTATYFHPNTYFKPHCRGHISFICVAAPTFF